MLDRVLVANEVVDEIKERRNYVLKTIPSCGSSYTMC